MTHGRRERTNAEWLDALAATPAPADVVADLADYLRRGLARGFRDRGGLREHDLDDLVQESLLRIMEGLAGFRGDSRFTTWALAVATRTALGELRRRRTRREGTLDLDDVRDAAGLHDGAHVVGRPAVPAPDARLSRGDLLGTLERLIRTVLTDRQRAAVLGELQGLPSAVLAERLGTNRNALYKLHHDARRKLRDALAEAGFDATDVRRELAAGSPT